MIKTFQVNFILSLTWMTLAMVKGDIFTAIAKLQPLIGTENQLLINIREYVLHERQRLQNIERLITFIEEERVNSPSSSDVTVDLGNPIQSFLLLRRLRRHWFTVNDYVGGAANHQNEYLEKANRFQNSRTAYPSEEDYQGSGEALLRLQETYALQTTSMAAGRLLGEKKSPSLLADDCFEIGRLAKPLNLNQHMEWMQEAKRRHIKGHDNIRTKIQALEHLASAFYEQREVEKALVHINQIIPLDPKNIFVSQWKALYERELKMQQLNDTSTEDERGRYRALCRGDETAIRKPLNPGEFRCRYAHYNRPRLFIRPAKEELLFDEPRMIYYHDILTDMEMEVIKQRALPYMKRAEVDLHGKSRNRISSIAWLDIFKSDDPLGKVLPRVQDYTGLSTKPNHTETLQVVNYGLGGFYDFHYDDETDGVSEGFQGMGKRIATVLFYLSDIEAGGATVFTKAGVQIPPVKGSAVLWYNYLKNGDRDLKTRHAGCPVLLGTKWASNLWIREFGQVFRRRCGLTRDDKY